MTALRVILHGKAANDPRLRAAVGAVRQDGHLVEVRVTWEPGDAARFTADAVDEARLGRIDCIVAGGGDGTINEVFAAADGAGLPSQCSLGVLPLGTANDFAHAAGVPVRNLTEALRIAATATPHAIDVGMVDGRLFVNLLSGGFGSRVTVETDPELKRRLGGLAYAITGLSRFADLKPSRGRFTAAGFSWAGSFMALAIGNGRQAGGGLPLCPNAVIDDGLLDLTILPELGPAARVEAFSRLLREGATAIRSQLATAQSPWIEYESGEDLNINLDGEPMVVRRFRVECRPRALQVRLGSGALLASATSSPGAIDKLNISVQ